MRADTRRRHQQPHPSVRTCDGTPPASQSRRLRPAAVEALFRPAIHGDPARRATPSAGDGMMRLQCTRSALTESRQSDTPARPADLVSTARTRRASLTGLHTDLAGSRAHWPCGDGYVEGVPAGDAGTCSASRDLWTTPVSMTIWARPWMRPQSDLAVLRAAIGAT